MMAAAARWLSRLLARMCRRRSHARDVLGDQEVDVAFVSGVERPHEVLVVQLALGLDLAAEACDGLGRRLAAGEHFESHDAAHDHVLRLVDFGHAAAAQGIENAVVLERELACGRP